MLTSLFILRGYCLLVQSKVWYSIAESRDFSANQFSQFSIPHNTIVTICVEAFLCPFTVRWSKTFIVVNANTFYSSRNVSFSENWKDRVLEFLLQALYACPLSTTVGQHHRRKTKQRYSIFARRSYVVGSVCIYQSDKCFLCSLLLSLPL